LLRMGVIVRQLSPFGISNWIRITVGLEEEMVHLKQALKKCWTTGWCKQAYMIQKTNKPSKNYHP
jgi:hypothetical protein